MSISSRFSIAVAPIGLVALAMLSACSTPTSPASSDLFNGRDMAGWEFVTVPAVSIDKTYQILPGGVIALNGQPTGYLATTATYTDYTLHFEWRWSGKPGNGGALLHIA